LIVFYLAVIAFGLGSAWRRWRWVGMAPLLFSLAYSLANGVARFSGWRYDLPADWIAYFYFALGVAEILVRIARAFGAKLDSQVPSQAARPAIPIKWPSLAAWPAFFMLMGLLPWILQLIASPRYADMTTPTLRARLEDAPGIRALGVTASDIDALSTAPGAVLEIGRVLYPRYFTRGNGLASAHPWPAFAPREFPRLGFLLLNQTRHDVVLPSRKMPQDLNHGADAIVLGCAADDYFEARLVLLVQSGLAYQSGDVAEPCP